MHTTLTTSPASRRLSAGGVAALSVVGLIGLTFVIRQALPYFRFSDVQFGRFLFESGDGGSTTGGGLLGQSGGVLDSGRLFGDSPGEAPPPASSLV